MQRFAVLLAVVTVAVVSAQQSRPPAIEAEGTEVSIRGSDLVLRDTAGASDNPIPPVSIRGLIAEVASLRAELSEMRANMSSRDGVQNQVDAAMAGVMAELRTEVAGQVNPLAARVAVNEGALVGSGGMVGTVALLAADVEYLRAHVDNVTSCAAGGELHMGSGNCMDPVPQCPVPEAPDGGSVVLSAEFIIPGVTARYSCAGARAFVAGREVRTCVMDTQAFDGTTPRCLDCVVSNCLRCVNATNTCAVCAFGHDLSDDRSSCEERAMTIVWLGGQYQRHNFGQAQALGPNTNQFRYFLPYAGGGTGGAAAIIRGNTYLVTSSFRMLRRGATTWGTFSSTNGPPASFSFYATINGEGSTEDGFYIFGLDTAAVFQPAVDDTQWTRFAALSGNQEPRRYGATAVIGKLIYCIGGRTQTNAVSDRIDVFNTTSRTWNTGPTLPDPRWGHSAAAYDGKIYVFGGRLGNGPVSNSVQELNPGTAQWVDKAEMPEAWEGMSTGPMPTYGNGEVIIPHAYKPNSGVATALKYSIRADSWEAGPSIAYRAGRYAVAFGTYDEE